MRRIDGNRISGLVAVGLIVLATGLAHGATMPDLAGILSIDPVMEQTCVSVAVRLAENQSVAGLRWYNNDAGTVFPYVMAVAGYEDAPPNLADAVVIVENVSGAEDGWSELAFDQAVASPTGLFYVVFQLPPNQQVTERGAGPGIGYTESDVESGVYLSAEGADWLRMVTTRKLLIEPVVVEEGAKSLGSVLLLPEPSKTEDGVTESKPEQDPVLPTALLTAYPNPFNPATRIAYSLRTASAVDIAIYDVRGRMVDRVHWDQQVPGRHEYLWQGTDNAGRRAASGVYLVKMKAGTYEGIERVVMLK